MLHSAGTRDHRVDHCGDASSMDLSARLCCVEEACRHELQGRPPHNEGAAARWQLSSALFQRDEAHRILRRSLLPFLGECPPLHAHQRCEDLVDYFLNNRSDKQSFLWASSSSECSYSVEELVYLHSTTIRLLMDADGEYMRSRGLNYQGQGTRISNVIANKGSPHVAINFIASEGFDAATGCKILWSSNVQQCVFGPQQNVAEVEARDAHDTDAFFVRASPAIQHEDPSVRSRNSRSPSPRHTFSLTSLTMRDVSGGSSREAASLGHTTSEEAPTRPSFSPTTTTTTTTTTLRDVDALPKVTFDADISSWPTKRSMPSNPFVTGFPHLSLAATERSALTPYTSEMHPILRLRMEEGSPRDEASTEVQNNNHSSSAPEVCDALYALHRGRQLICSQFEATGKCSFGSRCRYFHDSTAPFRGREVKEQTTRQDSPCVQIFSQSDAIKCPTADSLTDAHTTTDNAITFRSRRFIACVSDVSVAYCVQGSDLPSYDELLLRTSPPPSYSEASAVKKHGVKRDSHVLLSAHDREKSSSIASFSVSYLADVPRSKFANANLDD